MNFDEVYQFFGSENKACKAIGVGRATFSNWRKRGFIPAIQQLKFQRISQGKLVADIESAVNNKANTK